MPPQIRVHLSNIELLLLPPPLPSFQTRWRRYRLRQRSLDEGVSSFLTPPPHEASPPPHPRPHTLPQIGIEASRAADSAYASEEKEEEEDGEGEEEEQEDRTRGGEEEEEVQRRELHTKWLQDKEEEMESTLLENVRNGWMEAGKVLGVGMLDEKDDKKEQPEEEGREGSEEEIEEEEMENEEGEEVEEETVNEGGDVEGEEEVDEVAFERERWKQFLADSEEASVFVPFEDDEESQEMLRRGRKEVRREGTWD